MLEDRIQIVAHCYKSGQYVGVVIATADEIEAMGYQVSNAVFGLEGEVMALHSKATATLHQFWPDIADEVQAKGPGGR